MYGQGYDQAQGYRQQAMDNQLGLGSLQQGLASFVPGMEQQNLAALSAVGQQDQLLEQSKLNAMAQANQSAYQLPLDRITDVANIYGTVSGAMPGSPTQKFAPNPLLTGIGGFANMYTTLGGSAMTRGVISRAVLQDSSNKMIIMYNRILKRPMFKMGGRSYQAQGTGITSGLDTPKRGLVDGPGGYAGEERLEEISKEKINVTQPRESDRYENT